MKRGGAHVLFRRSEMLRDYMTLQQLCSDTSWTWSFPQQAVSSPRHTALTATPRMEQTTEQQVCPAFCWFRALSKQDKLLLNLLETGIFLMFCFSCKKTFLRTAKAHIKIFSAVRFLGYFLAMIKIQLFSSAWEQVRDQSNPALIYRFNWKWEKEKKVNSIP